MWCPSGGKVTCHSCSHPLLPLARPALRCEAKVVGQVLDPALRAWDCAHWQLLALHPAAQGLSWCRCCKAARQVLRQCQVPPGGRDGARRTHSCNRAVHDEC